MRGIDFNENWKFRLADELKRGESSEHKTGWQPYANNADRYFYAVHMDEDDSTWETVRLPHDWSIDLPFDLEKGEGCTGYLMGGIGWYRKYFVTTEEMLGKKVLVNFDGIYNRSNIYCNNEFITFHPYGYSPCLVDISEYLKPLGEENVISVKVDHSRYADSRWYTGSGIYRKVSMHILNQVNIPVWGVYVTTPVVTDSLAVLHAEVEIENNKVSPQRLSIKVDVVDPVGILVATKEMPYFAEPKVTGVHAFDIEVLEPMLWDLEATNRYDVIVTLSDEEGFIQTETVKIGIRTLRFDTNTGFFLNGVNHLLKGICVHHDGGVVGTAVPDDVWRRRLLTLKEGGCNAIRTAHNPYSKDFFDLCDEIGFLVQEEFYDEWDYPKDKRINCADRKFDYITRGHDEFFGEYAKADLQVVVKRDRNHPCIFQWSLGNEIEWGYPMCDEYTGYFSQEETAHWAWDLPPYSPEKIKEMIAKIPTERFSLRKTARNLATWTRELDMSRPIISNCVMPASSHLDGYTDALDLVGYSHRHMLYDYGHELYPDKPIIACESGTTWYQWKATAERDFIAGMFMWTGIDYIGEADLGRRGGVQKKGPSCGLIDFAGFKRPIWHQFKTLWTKEAHIFATTTKVADAAFILNETGAIVEKEEGLWKTPQAFRPFAKEHWNYEAGEEILIEAYTNCPEAKLYINDELISVLATKDSFDGVCRWIVPFSAGEVHVVGVGGDEVVNHTIKTAGALAAISLIADQDKITTDFDRVAHIEIELQDADGNRISHEQGHVTFTIEGPCKVLGSDNGLADYFMAPHADSVDTANGKAVLLLQGTDAGEITVTAHVGDVVSNRVVIEVCK
ncbi:MAG: glycoside hydrolase family 2 TIM barrel-domain containing protein [Lachnospiraceae bacterium]